MEPFRPLDKIIRNNATSYRQELNFYCKGQIIAFLHKLFYFKGKKGSLDGGITKT
jgi:hypothetical protein